MYLQLTPDNLIKIEDMPSEGISVEKAAALATMILELVELLIASEREPQ